MFKSLHCIVQNSTCLPFSNSFSQETAVYYSSTVELVLWLTTLVSTFKKNILILERVQRRATKHILADYSSNYKDHLLKLYHYFLLCTGWNSTTSCRYSNIHLTIISILDFISFPATLLQDHPCTFHKLVHAIDLFSITTSISIEWLGYGTDFLPLTYHNLFTTSSLTFTFISVTICLSF